MTEYIYFYEPMGYSPGYAYREYDKALAQLLDDVGFDSVESYKEELDHWNCYYEFGEDSFYVDDGSRITKVELV